MRLNNESFAGVRGQMGRLVEGVRGVLGEEVVGMYVHGSWAMGCFHAGGSDLDVLVVTERGMAVEQKYEVMELLLRVSNDPTPIEISFVVLGEMQVFEHPLLFDLHFSEMWRGQVRGEMEDGKWRRWNDVRRRDPDLAAHMMITRHRGVVLYGQSIGEIFPEVPKEDYVQAIMGDYWDARERRGQRMVYFVLNACRIHAFVMRGSILSKDEGGEYGLVALPSEFHGVIRQALEGYREGKPVVSCDEGRLERFAAFMDEELRVS